MLEGIIYQINRGLQFLKEIFTQFKKNQETSFFANLIRKSFCHDYKCADITEFVCSLELFILQIKNCSASSFTGQQIKVNTFSCG